MKRFLHLIILSSCMITGCICMLASCKNGNSYNNGKDGLDPNKPTVTVTIEPFRYFVEQIAGNDVNVNVMVPAGSSPETYEPTPQQMVDLSQSGFYFKVGQIGFEKTWMKKLQQNAPDMKVIDTSAGIRMLKTQSGNIDPHTWMSIKSADIITSNIAKALMEKYPKIKEFLDQTVLDARTNGYTKTMFGRIRPIPELNSSNFMQRQFGERVAMNSPIQGTAADIIKIAMIRVHDRLLDEGLKSRLILQVHDELLIETREAEKDKVIKLLEKEMRGAVDMKVSMEVGTECGYDWYDAH